MRISITGASGFIGSNLISYLKRYQFKIFNEITREELRNFNDLIFEKDEIIVHLAGKAHDVKKVSSPEIYNEVNHLLTCEAYDAFLNSSATKFVFISSVKAVADTIDLMLTEDMTPNPKTHYGKSKLDAEIYITSRPLPHGKYYYILRPCMIHGPGNKGNLNLLYKFIQKGIPYPLASFDNRRSYLSIENLCFVIKELIVNDSIPSGIYNIADDDPLSTNEVVSILSEKLKLKPRLWFIPITFVKLIAKIGDLIKLPLTTERLDKLTESYIVNNQKLKSALNQPLPVSAREGMARTAESFSSVKSL